MRREAGFSGGLTRVCDECLGAEARCMGCRGVGVGVWVGGRHQKTVRGGRASPSHARPLTKMSIQRKMLQCV